jgi:hypothetical protein
LKIQPGRTKILLAKPDEKKIKILPDKAENFFNLDRKPIPGKR